MSELEFFSDREFALQKGGVLPEARLAFQTFGKLSPARDNVIVSPTWYSGDHSGVVAALVGPDRALNPEKYFIVIPNLLGGGVSTSPSNAPSVGVKNNATASEADSVAIKVMGRYFMNSPTTPGQNKSGEKAAMRVAVAAITGPDMRLAASA